MSESKVPVTLAIRMLNDNGVQFVPHLFKYEEKGGTSVSSRELGVPEHAVIKTLIMENDSKEPLVILMHGDMQVSTKQLARDLGVKSINPCKPEVADRHSGYQVGGTSPFGTKRQMPVYMEKTILDLPKIYINGGKRGFLVEILPQEVMRLLSPTLVNVGIKG
ncbi:Cys-tRNA(Pro) deacylase [Bdellovibrio sp. NC01]|uniref:Cys-tRNA(Pro) deacylase n=1 Tax=Bdellovibrio sp. NC01 TaxID=2220073 RepID=UPI0011585FCF|nr:Cys-tRNA(Pro) deacylase [Bdellovibrio sp. NC01]QDK38147.1 Cys-tRNA(Pro) deacylase [Bdellovibrio sp. NC01]